MLELLPDAERQSRLSRRVKQDTISGWMNRVHAGEHPHAPSEVSSGLSLTTVSSVSTIRDLAGNDDTHGVYMTRPAREPRQDYAYAGDVDLELYHVR